ncbi:hypothetical protein LXA43DRAFT_997137 [Ganoderma leucocontextum]|nr:hypothetical protein LXA43DRAFT_997137 [Ganoderma leucocontextum]
MRRLHIPNSSVCDEATRHCWGRDSLFLFLPMSTNTRGGEHTVIYKVPSLRPSGPAQSLPIPIRLALATSTSSDRTKQARLPLSLSPPLGTILGSRHLACDWLRLSTGAREHNALFFRGVEDVIAARWGSRCQDARVLAGVLHAVHPLIGGASRAGSRRSRSGLGRWLRTCSGRGGGSGGGRRRV